MTKRRLLRWSLILAVLAAFAVWLEPTRVVWGWLRGEAFYQGRPTSWWRNEIAQWNCVAATGGAMRGIFVYRREPTGIEKFVSRFVDLPEKPWPELLDGDRCGQKVLQELLRDSNHSVRTWAEEGLKRHESKERGPGIGWGDPGVSQVESDRSRVAAVCAILAVPPSFPIVPPCNIVLVIAACMD